jgi:peptidoglycan hydrolase-like protein with peptidoglycan-binding domain
LEEQRWGDVRLNHVAMRSVFLAIAMATALAGSVSPKEKEGGGSSDTNVRMVQEKLHEAGFYFGEIDGAYSSELAAALGRYQIRNGLPITGQLDVETSKALGASPAVTTTANDRAESSETWRRLRANEGGTRTSAQVASSQSRETPPTNTHMPPRSAPTAATPIPPAETQSASAPLPANVSKERLRDYVGGFVLAGLDPHVGSEADFFADRVRYYDQGIIDREKIREDLQRYAARWPTRRFWLDGDISVEPQGENGVSVTFPLRYDLRNGGKHSSGRINKTLILERTGDDFQIVGVNERKAG